MITKNRIDYLVNTVWAIASSRYVQGFVIGYTARSGHERRREYISRRFDHLVVLADKLTKAEALVIEERLQKLCKQGAATGEPYRRKYHPQFREDAYRRSAGPYEVIAPEVRGHSVYMAWMEAYP